MGSTITSQVLTWLLGLLDGEALRSNRLMRRRLMVPLERRTVLRTVVRRESKRRTLHGRSGGDVEEGFVIVISNNNSKRRRMIDFIRILCCINCIAFSRQETNWRLPSC